MISKLLEITRVMSKYLLLKFTKTLIRSSKPFNWQVIKYKVRVFREGCRQLLKAQGDQFYYVYML